MPALDDTFYAQRRTQEDFELLLRRPTNYFKLSSARQWEIDKQLGCLDAWIEIRFLTDEMRQRWEQYFGVKL